MNPTRYFSLPSYINRVVSGYRRIKKGVRAITRLFTRKPPSDGFSRDCNVAAREFDRLIAEHGELVVRLHRHTQVQTERGVSHEGIAELRLAELQLRAKIVAWSPCDRREAYRKVEHIVRVSLTGVIFDHEAVQHILDSVQTFIGQRVD